MATRIYKTPFAATGDKEALATADQPDGKVSLQAGWTPDYELPNDNANYRPVGRSEMNGILNEVTEGLGEIQLNGFAKWQAVDGGWPLGAIVKHNGAAYYSLIDNNGIEPSIGSVDWVPVLTNNATTTVAGILRLATTALAQALTDDMTALTPKKLADAFKGSNQSLAMNGYQKLPGGLIFQWGSTSATAAANTLYTATLPITFPNVGLVIVSSTGVTGTNSVVGSTQDLTTTTFRYSSSQVGNNIRWVAAGF